MFKHKFIIEENNKKLDNLSSFKLRNERDITTIPSKYNFKVTILYPLGLLVEDLDVTQPLQNELIAWINTECQFSGIIVFRNARNLTAEEQIRVNEYFGSRQIYSTHGQHPKSPHEMIFRLSNDDKVGINGPGPQWHHDGSFEKALFTHFGMHAISPSKNGHTLFASS
mmetsp:Transcript_47946/g.40572  ORF Transcript_47946/g.40572 Transcript_47946/m.40572 type:complete len:168 (+) Transcript_47946:45-548(+)